MQKTIALKLTPSEVASQPVLLNAISQAIAEPSSNILGFHILKQSIDARSRQQVWINLSILAFINEPPSQRFISPIHFQVLPKNAKEVIIIGAGPAGLFCSLRLAEYGIPSLIFERGEKATDRMKKISKYWRKGDLDTENNVCYGEGGAGLFSDGKLITRIKSKFIDYVMNKFVELGAPKEVAYQANPHLGSNKIRLLIGKLTDQLKNKNCVIYYQSRVEGLLFDKKNFNSWGCSANYVR